MKKISETIVFFGSGPVAAKSLAKLAEDFVVEAVITKPRPAHHKADFPVIELAERLGLKLLTTSDSKDLVGLFSSVSLQSNIGVVIDYGIIIPQSVIDHFNLGIVNSHFSLLPKWRGPDPISFAILNGDKVTGVSLMVIVDSLDEGPLLDSKSIVLNESITTKELTDALIDLSQEMLCKDLPLYINNQLEPKAQIGVPTYSKKLTKRDGELDWNKPALQLEREVRAYIVWPRSRTKIGDTDIVVTAAHVTQDDGSVGELWTDGKTALGFRTSRGTLFIDKLIPAGRKEMSTVAFLAGYNISF